MTIPTVQISDLEALKELAEDLDFSDFERRAVLLENASRDINASPGSGKTSLLAAKLLILAKKWSFDKRGICVLSHTNVARDEIVRRLSATADGRGLLAYPHFIGTIHSFVDRFLALPSLRSIGITIDVIDDDVFSRRATSMAMKNWSIRTWAAKDASVMPMVGGLVFRGPELKLASEESGLPKPTAKTYPALEKIKATLADKGVFRYADMFAFAENLLGNSADLKQLLSNRFPLVFIDEMQDTSPEQEDLLAKLFDDTVAVQRFGDTNQRIFSSSASDVVFSFPKPDALQISTSKRFGPAIAAAVSSIRVSGDAMVGHGPDVHAPMLLTYTSARVGDVLNAFGRTVLSQFDDEVLRHGLVKALCTRKQSDAQQEPGRSIQDYWPSFTDQSRGAGVRLDNFWGLLAYEGPSQNGTCLNDRAADIKRALLLVLRSSNSPHISDVRDGLQLIRYLHNAGNDVSGIRQLCRDLALSVGLGATEEERLLVPDLFYKALHFLLPEGMTLKEFQNLEVFDAPKSLLADEKRQRVCDVSADGRHVSIQLGTVASMKGETHLATLVLESLGYPSRRFDLAETLPVMAGLKLRDPKLKESVLSQFRNLYVGMSRPTSFICLAANAARVSTECVLALEERGWAVQKLE